MHCSYMCEALTTKYNNSPLLSKANQTQTYQFPHVSLFIRWLWVRFFCCCCCCSLNVLYLDFYPSNKSIQCLLFFAFQWDKIERTLLLCAFFNSHPKNMSMFSFQERKYFFTTKKTKTTAAASVVTTASCVLYARCLNIYIRKQWMEIGEQQAQCEWREGEKERSQRKKRRNSMEQLQFRISLCVKSHWHIDIGICQHELGNAGNATRVSHAFAFQMNGFAL